MKDGVQTWPFPILWSDCRPVLLAEASRQAEFLGALSCSQSVDFWVIPEHESPRSELISFCFHSLVESIRESHFDTVPISQAVGPKIDLATEFGFYEIQYGDINSHSWHLDGSQDGLVDLNCALVLTQNYMSIAKW